MEKAEEVVHNSNQTARTNKVEITDWADNVVENSLWGNDDGMSDYFN